MKHEDIIEAKNEAQKFILFVYEWEAAESERDKGGWRYNNPVEVGLVRAQSLILSRALSAMRNPYCTRNERKRK